MSKQSLPLIGVTSACEVAPLVREPLSADSAAELAGVFKALSDPVRLRLLSLVASRVGAQACVCQLSEAFDLTQPTISHHLKVLREAGLLSSERRGSWVYYRLEPAVLAQLSQLLHTTVPAAVAP
ncbi:ArsR/SmtB family transcription factor [Nocardia lijiangensis]|uniref:ArsR/SmtB family transcription factor n=1 Tax=Nocardia lijiangensis TaxID=299618 RepID=UPI0008340F54|nr:metalloregulator ArsR/SmtB family transcription factor [Nocardia lijiangensis]